MNTIRRPVQDPSDQKSFQETLKVKLLGESEVSAYFLTPNAVYKISAYLRLIQYVMIYNVDTDSDFFRFSINFTIKSLSTPLK